MQNEQLILEVSQVNGYIKEMLDADGLLGALCIRGELSNYKKYPSGHHYFTLKDGQSQRNASCSAPAPCGSGSVRRTA